MRTLSEAQQMRALTDAEVLLGYQAFTEHVLAMERPNNYQYLEESYVYAKMRRDDFRHEYARRQERRDQEEREGV